MSSLGFLYFAIDSCGCVIALCDRSLLSFETWIYTFDLRCCTSTFIPTFELRANLSAYVSLRVCHRFMWLCDPLFLALRHGLLCFVSRSCTSTSIPTFDFEEGIFQLLFYFGLQSLMCMSFVILRFCLNRMCSLILHMNTWVPLSILNVSCF